MNKRETKEWSKELNECGNYLINLCEMNNKDKLNDLKLKFKGEKEDYYIFITRVDKKEKE